MNIFKACLVAGAVVSSLALSPVVNASPVVVTGYTVFGVNEHVSYTGRINSEYAGAGQITLQTSIGNILSWCTDLFDTLAPGTFTAGSLTTDQNGYGALLTSNQVAEIGGLINAGNARATTAQSSAAFQNAIWSVEYGSKFSFVSDDSSVAGLTNLYLSDIQNGTFARAGIVTQLTAANNQGQATTAVPEPASLALMASALLGLALITSMQGRLGVSAKSRKSLARACARILR